MEDLLVSRRVRSLRRRLRPVAQCQRGQNDYEYPLHQVSRTRHGSHVRSLTSRAAAAPLWADSAGRNTPRCRPFAGGSLARPNSTRVRRSHPRRKGGAPSRTPAGDPGLAEDDSRGTSRAGEGLSGARSGVGSESGKDGSCGKAPRPGPFRRTLRRENGRGKPLSRASSS